MSDENQIEDVVESQPNAQAQDAPVKSQNVNPPPLSAEAGIADAGLSMENLMDVPVSLQVMVGRSKMAVKDLLELKKGAVIELDKKVAEPLDLLVNGTLFARGEVVVANDRFGLRLVEIVNPAERKKLGK